MSSTDEILLVMTWMLQSVTMIVGLVYACIHCTKIKLQKSTSADYRIDYDGHDMWMTNK